MIRRASKADRTDADGVVWDSAAEMHRWAELRLAERAGLIKNLRRQVRFPLIIDGRPVLIRSDRYPAGRACKWTADFVYCEIEGNDSWPLRETAEDYKAHYTEADRLRIAVVESAYNIRVKISGPAKYRTTKKRYRSASISREAAE